MLIVKKIIINLKKTDSWVYPALVNLKTRYARTSLGPLWETFATSIFIFFAGFLWSKIFKMDVANFLPHLFAGMVIWKFYAQVITTSSTSYLDNAALIKYIKHEYVVHNLKGVFRDFLIFIHNLPICLLVIIYFNGLNYNFLYIFLSLPIILISSFCISYIMSLVCLRYRDLYYLTQSLIQLVFFFTPILWKPDQLNSKAIMFVVNPNIIYHYIEIIRGPLMGYRPTILNYSATLLFMIFLIFFANFLYKKYNSRIPYWL
jgi:lipopolysaccharide transport system permease protein